MYMFGNTKEKVRKKKKKKEMLLWRFNSKLAWKHKCLAWFFCSFFLLFSFVLEKVFLLWHNELIIYWVGQGISSLAQWLDNPIYSRSYKGFTYELCLKKFNTENNLEASSQGVFWSQNWIHFVVSFDSWLR